MNITDKIFPSTVQYESSSLLASEYTLNQEVSSNLSVDNASDNPTSYGQATLLRADASQNNVYLAATNSANETTESVYNATTQIQTIMSKVGELMTEVNGSTGASTYADYGAQMASYASQIAQIANTQNNGVYLFGGTSNQPPLTAIVPAPATPNAPTLELNPANNNTVQSYTIGDATTTSAGLPVGNQTGTAGLLTDGTSALDTYTLVATLAQDLQNATSSTTDPFASDPALTATNSNSLAGAVTLVDTASSMSSENVGKVAAQLSLFSLNTASLNALNTNITGTISNLTTANTAAAATSLTEVQTAYSAALSAASKILNMSILNYIS